MGNKISHCYTMEKHNKFQKLSETKAPLKDHICHY